MNTNEKSKTVWPGARAARRRLLRITLVLLPLSLVVFALLVVAVMRLYPPGLVGLGRVLWARATAARPASAG